MFLIKSNYEIEVDYNRSLADMIKATKRHCVDGNINAKHFPLKGKGKHKLTAALFHFNRSMESEDAIAEMDKRGYRPGHIEELLAFDEKHPDFQRKFVLVAALGSVWRNQEGDRLVPYLDWYNFERQLDLCCFWNKWFATYRFLAFRK